MVYDVKNGALVPAGEGLEEALAAFERADTEAIVEHLTTSGVDLAHFLYSFPIEGREVVGIGWAGAKELARLLGNIEVLPDVKVEERDDAFYGLVRVRDLSRNVTFLGAARQSKTKTLRSGEVKPDEHAFVVAIDKAQRNGILALVDEATKVRLVTEFLATRKKALGKPGQPKVAGGVPQAPPKASEAQLRAIHTIAEEKGISKEELHRLAETENLKELTVPQASSLIDRLKQEPKRERLL